MGLNIDKLPSEQDVNLIVPKFGNIAKTVHDLSVGDTLSISDIETIVYTNYYLFLNDPFLSDFNQRKDTINTFSNRNFIIAMINCIKSGRIFLTDVQKICCNKVIWDTIFIDINNEIKSLLMELAALINVQVIMVLPASLDISTKRMIALVYHSSFNNTKCVERVNRILSGYIGLNAQIVIDVYSVLFNTNLTLLFEATLFDIHPITDVDKDNWNIIFFALMTIMENVDSDTIYKVLESYSTDYRLKGSPAIRFAFEYMDTKRFPRVFHVINMLKMEGIIVP